MAGVIVPITIFVQYAVPVSLLQGVPGKNNNYTQELYLSFSLPVAILFLVAGVDALIDVGHY